MRHFPQDAFQRNLNAIVTPLEKKGTRDSSQLKNYRPVSNLPFLSKLLEKVVQNQLQHHITSNDAMPKFQSAYRQFHSTETALTKIFNDLLLAADQGQLLCVCYTWLLRLTLLTTLCFWHACNGVLVFKAVVWRRLRRISVRSKLLRGHQRCRLSCNPCHVFGLTGLGPGPVVIYPVHGGSGWHFCTVQLDITCVHWR